jgi:hypothetical protein
VTPNLSLNTDAPHAGAAPAAAGRRLACFVRRQITEDVRDRPTSSRSLLRSIPVAGVRWPDFLSSTS